MSYRANTNVQIQDGTASVRLSYECWANQQGEAIVSVQGQTQADHDYLAANRTAVADAIKQEEGLDQMRYFENQGNGLHTEVALTTNEQGRVTDSLLVNGSSLRSDELARQGQQLLDQEHDHTMQLPHHGFGEELQKFRTDPGIGHD